MDTNTRNDNPDGLREPTCTAEEFHALLQTIAAKISEAQAFVEQERFKERPRYPGSPTKL
ncbi:hypothetical protein [Paenibacillus glycinis]|uniref:Transposase n=1 Tax=Paenibacillus glycinis TaxID=2697035 RepID=A0ABW9XWC5_9BACL|nr:hypothetical protein [Paenibacillus glycinis]NBD26576.1 hypothetical protein [Paenibacillus glycinis]